MRCSKLPSHANSYPKIVRPKFWDSHFFSIVEKSNNYVIDDNLNPLNLMSMKPKFDNLIFDFKIFSQKLLKIYAHNNLY